MKASAIAAPAASRDRDRSAGIDILLPDQPGARPRLSTFPSSSVAGAPLASPQSGDLVIEVHN
jgi:hypothetical protein